MRRESNSERAAWTEHVTGQRQKQNKYHVADKEVRGSYASKHEGIVAGQLAALVRAGDIRNLREQVPFVLVPGDGKIRPVKYVADFVWEDAEGLHIADAKGCKTPMYRLKKKLMRLLLGITIEEL